MQMHRSLHTKFLFHCPTLRSRLYKKRLSTDKIQNAPATMPSLPMIYDLRKRKLRLCLGLLFLLDELSIASVDENVVPLNELLDIRVVYAVTIVIGKYGCHEFGKFCF